MSLKGTFVARKPNRLHLLGIEVRVTPDISIHINGNRVVEELLSYLPDQWLGLRTGSARGWFFWRIGWSMATQELSACGVC